MEFQRLRIILLVSMSLGFAGNALAQKDPIPKIELGPEVNNIYLPISTVGGVNYQVGLGGVFSFNFNRFIGLDGSASITPTPTSTGSSFAGGRLTQLNIGLRAGITKRRFAFYGKIRPGFASFGNVIQQVNLQTLQFRFGRLTEPALDYGGIVQVYLSKRFALRYEAGDTLIDYRSRSLFTGFPPVPGRTTHNFEFGIGFIFRFR